jgi:GNAT superfamily N-acetyltransferase
MRSSDADVAVELVRQTFEARLLPMMTFAQSGAADFLRVGLDYPGSTPSSRLVVATDEGRVIGFADFRLAGSGKAFLSYICVHESARGRGVATALVEYFFDANEVASLELDVFENNAGAIALYDRLGFETASTSSWVTRELPAPGPIPAVEELASSIASLHRFGFSTIKVQRDRGTVRFGLLGEMFIRCFDVESFDDDSLLSSVRSVHRTAQRAFAVADDTQLKDLRHSHRVEVRSLRMRLDRLASKGTR